MRLHSNDSKANKPTENRIITHCQETMIGVSVAPGVRIAPFLIPTPHTFLTLVDGSFIFFIRVPEGRHGFVKISPSIQPKLMEHAGPEASEHCVFS